jgi:hypothetical protein
VQTVDDHIAYRKSRQFLGNRVQIMNEHYGDIQIQDVKKTPSTPPILRFTTCEETVSCLFNNLLSPILKNPCKTAHPVVEDALHFIESELIPYLRNRLFNPIARVNLAIFQDFLQQFKELKVAGTYVW